MKGVLHQHLRNFDKILEANTLKTCSKQNWASINEKAHKSCSARHTWLSEMNET
jgi:hypothetical protein